MKCVHDALLQLTNEKIVVMITFMFLDAIASQEIPYIQVSHLVTPSVTELKSSSRSGLLGLSDHPKMSRKAIYQ